MTLTNFLTVDSSVTSAALIAAKNQKKNNKNFKTEKNVLPVKFI
jgi:hypothetical protein